MMKNFFTHYLYPPFNQKELKLIHRIRIICAKGNKPKITIYGKKYIITDYYAKSTESAEIAIVIKGRQL